MAILYAGADTAITNMSSSRHRPLVDAIATGNPDTARRAVDLHLQEAARNLLISDQE